MKFKGDTIEEHKAEVLIKLRKYKLIKKEKHEGAVGYTVSIPKDKEKALVWCILDEATVGIAMMNNLYKLLEEKGLERAIVHDPFKLVVVLKFDVVLQRYRGYCRKSS